MELSSFTNPENNIRELGVHEGMVVADLGAGTGVYTVPLARLVGESGRVYAVEVQKDFLSNIKNATTAQGFKNVELIWGDIERPLGTKIKEGSVDAVVISNVLFQAEDKAGLFREANRILKTGGKMLLVDWKESFGGLGPSKNSVVPADIAREMCEREGFVLKKDFDAGEHHYGLVMYKG